MMKKIFSLALLLLLSVTVLVAQDLTTLPKVTYSGREYYIYSATKDETVYGVAKRFGWDVEKLMEANPGIEATLKSKQKLFYPVGAESESAAAYPKEGIRHKVERGETVFGLARKYGVSVDEIYSANPSSQYGLKTGEILLIKPASTFTQTTAQSENSVKNNEETIDSRSQKSVSFSDPVPRSPELVSGEIQEIDNVEPVPEIEERLEGLPSTELERVRFTILLSQDNSKRDVDFVRGILTALKGKSGEWKVDLKIIPSQIEKISQLIADNGIPESDVIITTYDKIFPAELADYCAKNNIPVVNVFDLKSDLYKKSKGFIQLLPPSDEFNSAAVEEIAGRFEDRLFIFCGEDKGDALGALLEEKIPPVDKISVSSTAELGEVEVNGDSRLVIYCYPSAKKDMTPVLDKVISMKEQNPLAEISVIGRPNWVVFDDTMSEKFTLADTYIPSRFYFNPKGLDEKQFTEAYKWLTGFTPVRSFPLYAAMGYDIANYFIPAVKSGKIDKGEPGFTPLQLDIKLEEEIDGGYLNDVVYLLRFTPYGTIEKILAK